MDEGQALLRGILAEPEPDAPRLVYADWLEDNGQPARARLVRLGCERERLAVGDPRRERVTGEILALEREQLAVWLGPLDPDACRDPSEPHGHFHRGLLYWWYVTVGAFLRKAHQRAVCERFPQLGVDHLFLSEPSKRAAALAESPALAWASELSWIRSRADDDAVAALANSPHLGMLSVMALSHVRCSDAGLRAVANARGLANLRRFSLRACFWGGQFTAAGVLLVLNSERLPRLRYLRLASGMPYGFRLADVLRDAGLSRLSGLILHDEANPDAVAALAANPTASGLEELDLSSGRLDDASASALAESPHLARLKRLRLTGLNNERRRLSPAVEERLRRRFGAALEFSYGVLVRD